MSLRQTQKMRVLDRGGGRYLGGARNSGAGVYSISTDACWWRLWCCCWRCGYRRGCRCCRLSSIQNPLVPAYSHTIAAAITVMHKRHTSRIVSVSHTATVPSSKSVMRSICTIRLAQGCRYTAISVDVETTVT